MQITDIKITYLIELPVSMTWKKDERGKLRQSTVGVLISLP